VGACSCWSSPPAASFGGGSTVCKTRRTSIGSFPQVSLAEARAAREKARALVKQGIHPAHERQQVNLNIALYISMAVATMIEYKISHIDRKYMAIWSSAPAHTANVNKNSFRRTEFT
jgi:hypothetical protein